MEQEDELEQEDEKRAEYYNNESQGTKRHYPGKHSRTSQFYF